MELLITFGLLFASVVLIVYQLSVRRIIGDVHLPSDIKGGSQEGSFDFIKSVWQVSSSFTDSVVEKANIPLENLKRKIISAGRPINVSQFFTFKALLTVVLPVLAYFIAYTTFHTPLKPPLVILLVTIGFLYPDLWLNSKIQKRHMEILKDLPHIIDLLNICVGAGLDFMVAVNRVITEFRQCALVEEFKAMVNETQMGSSRRDALKNLAGRINTPEVHSFVRTLLQADRMGTSIGEALRIQADEIRVRRFQRGEEMALKAPIKLLFPLLFFILPVVLIIVAGPILIQFTRGGSGLIKF